MAEVNEQLEQANAIENTAVREWTLGPDKDGNTRTYKQTKLPFIKKFRFFGLLGGMIRSAVATSGQGAVSDLLGNANSLRERAAQFNSSDIQDAEQFLNLVSSVLIYIPDFLEKSYCEWLSIPYGEEREWAVAMMEKDEDEGGLSDEMGIEIINTFVRQNWDDLRDFFVVHLRGVLTTVQNQTKTEEVTEESPLSKPLSITQPDTVEIVSTTS